MEFGDVLRGLHHSSGDRLTVNILRVMWQQPQAIPTSPLQYHGRFTSCCILLEHYGPSSKTSLGQRRPQWAHAQPVRMLTVAIVGSRTFAY